MLLVVVLVPVLVVVLVVVLMRLDMLSAMVVGHRHQSPRLPMSRRCDDSPRKTTG